MAKASDHDDPGQSAGFSALASSRIFLVGISILACVSTVSGLAALLPRDTFWAVLVLDHSSQSSFRFPFTIQVLLLLLFFTGLGDLGCRAIFARREMRWLRQGLLPEDDETVLEIEDLQDVRKRIAGKSDGESGFLPDLLDRCILQVQANRSVQQAVSVLDSSLELLNHRLDLRYQLIRYLVWAIPTVGFIGTVVGIAQSLAFIRPDDMDLGLITAGLSVAFNTTIVALVLSALLVLGQSWVQKREETSLNLAGDYCLRNLVNRLYLGD